MSRERREAGVIVSCPAFQTRRKEKASGTKRERNEGSSKKLSAESGIGDSHLVAVPEHCSHFESKGAGG